MTGAPAAGWLLISSAILVEPPFARTIILLLNVDADGSLGVVLNRPSHVAVGEVLGGWGPVVATPEVIFRGGPVDTDSALGVATLVGGEDEPIGWSRLFADTGLVDLDAPTEVIGSATAAMRIYAGYAGWSAGQLEDEIDEGAWYVVPAERSDLFSPDPDLLWRQVLRRQGAELALMITMPADPTLN
ncbi:MAG: hypothetical protein JWR35_3400 [Marmoricola sp.]|jgi:putative transcriptional regulator|nr:hypothetical protein [Marmoricola sp.]